MPGAGVKGIGVRATETHSGGIQGCKTRLRYRADLVVEGLVLVEIKAVENLTPLNDAQLLSYLKLGGWKVGLILNFNVHLLKQGIRRKVLNLDEEVCL